MTTPSRIHKLQQIPVFALRKLIYSEQRDPEIKRKMEEAIRNQLNFRSQNVLDMLKYQSREKLIQVISAIPEIDDTLIDNLFEEYRYGANPSFCIFTFDPSLMEHSARIEIQGSMNRVIREFNTSLGEDLPRVCKLDVYHLLELDGNFDVIEGNYSFQRRMDFVDESQSPTSVYETLYGFFWIHTRLGYVIIQSRDRKMLKILKDAIGEGAGIHLSNLVVTKQLRDALPFLDEADLRSSRLYDPDPDSDLTHYRWISIKDDDPYQKGYDDLEKDYPEVMNSNYHIHLGANKETTLKIYLEDGSLSLMGKLTATEFRQWCLERLSEIIEKIQALKNNPVHYVETRGLNQVPELTKFSTTQRNQIRTLIGQLLTLQKSPRIGYADLNSSPLLFAADMQRLVTVQFLKKCEEQGCGEEAYFRCGHCEETLFNVQFQDSRWILECPSHRSKPWSVMLPIKGCCTAGHPFVMDQQELEEIIEILPTDSLLRIISQVVERYVQGYSFSADLETFVIRGTRLIHHHYKLPAVVLPQKTVVIEQSITIGTMESGSNFTAVDLENTDKKNVRTRKSKTATDELVP